MAVDIFLKLADINGESVDSSHTDEIDVLSWSWGMSQSGTTHSGSGGGSGKVNVQDLSITKYVDSSSCDLMKCCANGKHLADGKLTVRKAGETPLEFLTIDLTEILVAAVSTGGIGSDDRMTENVTLNFRKFEIKYKKQKEDGSGEDKGDTKWDIAKNVEA
jgi:type VI secretion system secreted protein Hcp